MDGRFQNANILEQKCLDTVEVYKDSIYVQEFLFINRFRFFTHFFILNYQTPWRRVLFKKLIVAKLSKKISTLHETSWLHHPATVPYLEPHESNPYTISLSSMLIA